jgi:hypothetical protein
LTEHPWWEPERTVLDVDIDWVRSVALEELAERLAEAEAVPGERQREPGKPGSFDPWSSRRPAIEAALAARRGGATLRQAAAAAGVHVATLCRWQARSPALAEALEEARREAWGRRSPRNRLRPHVPWDRRCPLCGANVLVLAATRRESGRDLLLVLLQGWPEKFRFWRCSRWPSCRFASWRPRAPGDCPRCGAARFWSHSRQSIGCSGCGARTSPE